MKSKLAATLLPYVAGEQPKGNVIKLNTNENPYPPSPAAIAALRAYDTDRLRLYPDPTAEELRGAIAEIEGVSKENVFVGNGSDEVLSLAFAAFFDADSAPVLFPDVTYSFYKVFCSLYNIRYETVPLKSDFTIDPADYIGRNVSGIVIANPNAPTAVSLQERAMRAMIEAYKDKAFIADEAYVDFSSSPSLVPLTGEYDNLLVVKTFSKSRNLAGARCGYAIGNKELIDTLRSVKDCFNSYTVNSLTAALARASVLDQAYFSECVAKIKSTRGRLTDGLQKLGFTVLNSDANFVFARCDKMSGGELQAALRRENIVVRRFDAPRISDYLRITVGTDEQVDVLLDMLKTILN